jgi:hypothetical protein
MIQMSRSEGATSNYGRSSGAFRIYEKQYSTLGPQEWITFPDAGQSKVVISFQSPGAAFLEGSCSCPTATNAGLLTPVVYPLTDTVTDVTQVTIEGDAAIRLNVLGGSAVISVRC